jgi:hypothetical protein
MIRGIVFCCLLSLTKFATSQSVYYGYPNGKELKKGDIIIVSLPEHIHMRFQETEQTLALYQFLTANQGKKFIVSIHLYIDSPEYDLSVSKHLKKSLDEMLAVKCSQCNVSVVAKGRSTPIFSQEKETTSLYRKMNTRMEILIE